METSNSGETMSFSSRLGLAVRVLFNAAFAQQAATALLARNQDDSKPASGAAPRAPAQAPEQIHGSGLMLLAALQREGRLIDFLQQDVAGFPDEDVGAAARVVHAGCNKVLRQYLDLTPALPDTEGSTVTVPSGFDAQRIRLTGNVAGQPPYRGALKHHGWVATQIRFPTASESIDARVLAPAEVEL